MASNGKKSIGDCEFCDAKNVELLTQHNNLMCQNCIDKENAVVTRRGEVNQILAESKRIDATLKIDTDIMTAETVALVQLRAAIENDENIPADRKEFAYAKAGQEHIIHLKKLNFQRRQEILDDENKILFWQKNVREVAHKLHEADRAALELQDSSYKPTSFKKEKVAKQSKPGKIAKKFNKVGLIEACKKYGVPFSNVEFIYVKRPGITYDAAARIVAEQFGKDIK